MKVEKHEGGVDIPMLVRMISDGWDRRDAGAMITGGMNVILQCAFQFDTAAEATQFIQSIEKHMHEAIDFEFTNRKKEAH